MLDTVPYAEQPRARQGTVLGGIRVRGGGAFDDGLGQRLEACLGGLREAAVRQFLEPVGNPALQDARLIPGASTPNRSR